MEIDQLKEKLKKEIIQYLNLLDITSEDIKDDTPFFGDDLALDSIDSIELIVLLEREYGIKIKNPVEGRKVLIDVNHMSAYIIEHSTKM